MKKALAAAPSPPQGLLLRWVRAWPPWGAPLPPSPLNLYVEKWRLRQTA